MMADRDEIWERGWEGHEREQLIRLARLPLAQKLQWLEEAHRLVRQLTGAAVARSARSKGDELAGTGHRGSAEIIVAGADDVGGVD
jgi:hypothetical protein